MENTPFDLQIKKLDNLEVLTAMKPYYESKDGRFKLYLADSFEFLRDFSKNSFSIAFAKPIKMGMLLEGSV